MLYNVAIVGTGPAGLTAAIYAARAGFEPIMFTGLMHGGQLTTTTEIENFPGFAEPIMGPKLMEDMTEQAKRVGTQIIAKQITKVEHNDKTFKLFSDKEQFSAKSVIIATGATAKTLGLANEAKLMGRGLSTCATCDGFFYRNKDVIVVGGGDSAMEEALYLAKLCKSVRILHRRDGFRASEIMLKRAKEHSSIEFLIPYVPVETLYDNNGLTGVKIKNAQTNETQTLDCDGLFYAIGHRPNSEVFRNLVDTDETGYITVNDYTKTKTPGLFAAGDIADSTFRQAVTAAGMGCQAAMQAARFLEEN